jgi:hypothetical protein
MPALSLARLLGSLLAPKRAPRHEPASPGLAIPAPFSDDQARLLLALKELGTANDDATWLMWASESFSQAQVVCGLQMLALGLPDFRATLADAMWPGPLRGMLLRGGDIADKGLARLRLEVPLEVERVHGQESRWALAGER